MNDNTSDVQQQDAAAVPEAETQDAQGSGDVAASTITNNQLKSSSDSVVNHVPDQANVCSLVVERAPTVQGPGPSDSNHDELAVSAGCHNDSQPSEDNPQSEQERPAAFRTASTADDATPEAQTQNNPSMDSSSVGSPVGRVHALNDEGSGEPDGADQAEEGANEVPVEDDGWESISTASSEEFQSEAHTSAVKAALEDVKVKVDQIMSKQKPSHSWSLIKELHKRQQGVRPQLLQADKFRLHMYNSLHAVERLELQMQLSAHDGCVNCLNWNQAGDRLASGSDDLQVVVWDWQHQKPAFSYNSGHKSNVFEVKFVPLCGDTHIVSTSRDGQVRLAEVAPDGSCPSVRRLAMHQGSGRKLALPPDSPHHVLSCGDDSIVYNIDIREDKAQILTMCMDDGKKVPANSMAAHPENSNFFLLACVDKFVRVYDRRMIGNDRRAYRRLCPHKLLGSGYRYSVTCAQFNHNGSRIVASYNDEDIYLFDSSHSDGADAVHQYSGHRNNVTIKGVNFYGPESRYVVSGSDCGNIFFWDVDTEAIVKFMRGDEQGVVNCLEPHPHSPVLATSGLDDDVKIWLPSADQPTDLSTLKETVERNLRERVVGDAPSAESLGSSLMWSLMRQAFSSTQSRYEMMRLDHAEMEDDSSDEDYHPGDCRTS